MENKDKERLQKLFDEFLDQDLFQISLGNPPAANCGFSWKSGSGSRFFIKIWTGKSAVHG